MTFRCHVTVIHQSNPSWWFLGGEKPPATRPGHISLTALAAHDAAWLIDLLASHKFNVRHSVLLFYNVWEVRFVNGCYGEIHPEVNFLLSWRRVWKNVTVSDDGVHQNVTMVVLCAERRLYWCLCCRAFYLALYKHVMFLEKRGCPRTALEYCKLILRYGAMEGWDFKSKSKYI